MTPWCQLLVLAAGVLIWSVVQRCRFATVQANMHTNKVQGTGVAEGVSDGSGALVRPPSICLTVVRILHGLQLMCCRVCSSSVLQLPVVARLGCWPGRDSC